MERYVRARANSTTNLHHNEPGQTLGSVLEEPRDLEEAIKRLAEMRDLVTCMVFRRLKANHFLIKHQELLESSNLRSFCLHCSVQNEMFLEDRIHLTEKGPKKFSCALMELTRTSSMVCSSEL